MISKFEGLNNGDGTGDHSGDDGFSELLGQVLKFLKKLRDDSSLDAEGQKLLDKIEKEREQFKLKKEEGKIDVLVSSNETIGELKKETQNQQEYGGGDDGDDGGDEPPESKDYNEGLEKELIHDVFGVKVGEQELRDYAGLLYELETLEFSLTEEVKYYNFNGEIEKVAKLKKKINDKEEELFSEILDNYSLDDIRKEARRVINF